MSNVVGIDHNTELDLEGAAAYLGWRPKTLYNRICDRHSLRAPARHKRWGRWYFYVRDLEAFKRSESEFVA